MKKILQKQFDELIDRASYLESRIASLTEIPVADLSRVSNVHPLMIINDMLSAYQELDIVQGELGKVSCKLKLLKVKQ